MLDTRYAIEYARGMSYEELVDNFYSHYDYDHDWDYYGPFTDAPWGTDD